MKVTIRETKKYEIVIGSYCGEFELVSTWQGLSEFKNNDGTIILMINNELVEDLTNFIFKTKVKDTDAHIVKCSEFFIKLLGK